MTLLEVVELAVDGGFRKLNLVFNSGICGSFSSDESPWYLDWEVDKKVFSGKQVILASVAEETYEMNLPQY